MLTELAVLLDKPWSGLLGFFLTLTALLLFAYFFCIQVPRVSKK